MPARTHGLRHVPEYSVWAGMRRRCNDKNHKNYSRYGGRGITICERWNNFLNFYHDMGKRPIGTTIERINNNGPYSPENCRWATRSAQMRNTYRTRPIVEGDRFGKLTAISHAGVTKEKRQQWLFLCDCGEEHIARLDRVVAGRVRSCGCIRTGRIIEFNKQRRKIW